MSGETLLFYYARPPALIFLLGGDDDDDDDDDEAAIPFGNYYHIFACYSYFRIDNNSQAKNNFKQKIKSLTFFLFHYSS